MTRVLERHNLYLFDGTPFRRSNRPLSCDDKVFTGYRGLNGYRIVPWSSLHHSELGGQT
ncbi:hypothetical protein KEM60_03157 [Austwickia sp. TVS 96-490-7B]|nr:hypothetical protein [Austwickia sp. TVS 96-490-7B]